MSKEDFLYLRHWLTGETYSPDCPSRPVILECIRSRSGISMGVYDRGERLFTVNGCGFDRIGTALARFLENCFMPELIAFARVAKRDPNANAGRYHRLEGFRGFAFHPSTDGHGGEGISLEGASGVNSMIEVANAIGLSVHLSESKAGTLIIIEKKGS